MDKRKILIIGLIALIVIALSISLIFIINKYTSVPVSVYDDDLNEEENIDSEIIDIEDNPIINDTDQDIDDDNTVVDDNKTSSSGNSSSNKNDSTTSTITKPDDTDSSDNFTDNEEQQTPTEEPTDNISEPVKYYTSWGMETTAPKYESMDACIQAGEEIRLTSMLEDGFYEIGQIGCTEIYDSKKSSRNLLGYNIIELICVDYVYNDDGSRTQVNYDCTDKYLK